LHKYRTPNMFIKNNLQLELKLNIQKDDFVLGYVGRLTRDKGIVELIEAFKLLNNKYKNFKLLILGELDDQSNLPDNIKFELFNNKNIINLGYINNPEKYYYLMDLFVFPTYREGFGNVSIQAQAAGVPVLATNVTGAKDTIINGKTGYLIKPKNVKEIVD